MTYPRLSERSIETDAVSLPREHSVVQQVDSENVLEQKADRQDG